MSNFEFYNLLVLYSGSILNLEMYTRMDLESSNIFLPYFHFGDSGTIIQKKAVTEIVIMSRIIYIKNHPLSINWNQAV
jgi:hypothetical protein